MPYSPFGSTMRFPPIDVFSFWLGFGTAALIVFGLFQFRRQISQAREGLYARLRGLREALTAGAERNWREEVYRYAQTAHLAGSLFPLDAILLPPRLLVPEPPPDPTQPPPDEDLNTIIPVIPEWPELAALYRAPTIGVEEAFAGSAPVVVLGRPGSGKTTRLAHLATRAAQSDEKLFPDHSTPIFIHAADLELPLEPTRDVAQPLIAAALQRASALTAARLPRHLRLRLAEFACVILMDGFDELPQSHTTLVAEWLAQFKKQYPQHRLIAAAGLTGYGPLTDLGFAPIQIAPWGPNQHNALIYKWGALWEAAQARARGKKKTAPTDIDAHLLMGWLKLGNRGRSVFELTLKIWAAFAGDARGHRPVDWLEAYLLRQSLKPVEQQVLPRIALALLAQTELAGAPRKDLAELIKPLIPQKGGLFEIDPDALVDGLVNKQVLIKQGKDRLNFRFSLPLAYAAAKALAAGEAAPPTATAAPLWNWALYMMTAIGDLTPLVAPRLSQPPDLLQTESLACAMWLRDSAGAGGQASANTR